MEQPRCSECHRLLSDPKSIARGVGPVCWGKLQAERGTTVPKGTIPLPSKRQYRNPKLSEKLVGIHQRLDLFINVHDQNSPAGERELEELLAETKGKKREIDEI